MRSELSHLQPLHAWKLRCKEHPSNLLSSEPLEMLGSSSKTVDSTEQPRLQKLPHFIPENLLSGAWSLSQSPITVALFSKPSLSAHLWSLLQSTVRSGSCLLETERRGTIHVSTHDGISAYLLGRQDSTAELWRQPEAVGALPSLLTSSPNTTGKITWHLWVSVSSPGTRGHELFPLNRISVKMK